MLDYEFDPHNTATWKTWLPPTRPPGFDEALGRIGGVNTFGKPILRVVWGGTELSDRAHDRSQLKYPAGFTSTQIQGWKYLQDGEWRFAESPEDVPDNVMVYPAWKQEPIGMPRWVVEIWVSPEELERQNRFRNQYYPGEIAPLLREFPKEGVYDCYLTVENREGKFRQLDGDVLEFIAMKFRYEQKPFAEREADLQRLEDLEREQRRKEEDELWRAAFNFDLRLSKEEKERREEYWAKHHDYSNNEPATFIRT